MLHVYVISVHSAIFVGHVNKSMAMSIQLL